ncbi:apolipoprotein E [Tachyglossus aculeatus]|uniref:apolipoprotein E n=1 Tax=Tachyglossus aculeatus TaxID=9261 RepID=UPI0018F71E23|nr:apolipoprotein E [Tachyglossus aculeatus]
MKLLWALFAVALLAGCRADPLPLEQDLGLGAEKTQQPWEEALERFWSYVVQVPNMAQDMRDKAVNSQINKEINMLLEDTTTEFKNLKEQLEPAMEDTRARIHKELTAVVDRLQGDLQEAKERVTHYETEIQAMVGHNLEELRSRTSSQLRKLRKRIFKDAEELRRRLTVYGTGAWEGIERGVGVFQERLEPIGQRIQAKGQERVQVVGELVNRQVKDLGSRVQNYGEQVKEKIEELQGQVRGRLLKAGEETRDKLDDLKEKLEEMKEKMERQADEVRQQLEKMQEQLRGWFQPLVQDVQAQWTNLLEKVQGSKEPVPEE